MGVKSIREKLSARITENGKLGLDSFTFDNGDVTIDWQVGERFDAPTWQRPADL